MRVSINMVHNLLGRPAMKSSRGFVTMEIIVANITRQLVSSDPTALWVAASMRSTALRWRLHAAPSPRIGEGHR